MQAGDITFLGDRWGKAGLVQIQHAVVNSLISGSTQMPMDDTIPQNTEGIEVITCAITPKNKNNKLLISAVINPTHNTSGGNTSGQAALFKDSDSDALASVQIYVPSTKAVPLVHLMTAGTTSSVTFKVRAGVSAGGTTYFNGIAGGSTRFGGGVAAMTLTIIEYAQ